MASKPSTSKLELENDNVYQEFCESFTFSNNVSEFIKILLF